MLLRVVGGQVSGLSQLCGNSFNVLRRFLVAQSLNLQVGPLQVVGRMRARGQLFKAHFVGEVHLVAAWYGVNPERLLVLKELVQLVAFQDGLLRRVGEVGRFDGERRLWSDFHLRLCW